ncbi:MAG: tetratricopeptide repeat protein [Spirochaetes bacterium]|nr:tetratricopeptide repeat protein [Spirochaetota bacterium]
MAVLASLPAWLTTLLIGALFLGCFTGLAALRRQKPSIRFLVEGGILTAAAVALCFLARPVYPILFLVILYLVTMRVRLLVDLSNVLTSRRCFRAALTVQDFAMRLGPDSASRQIALISRGVTQLRMGEPQAAYFTLKSVLLDEAIKPAARDQAAGFYNLGVACERTNRPQEAERCFRAAIEAMPSSIYALGADKALKRAASRDGRGSASGGEAPGVPPTA